MHYHSITGFDTTSYPVKMIKNGKVSVLENFGSQCENGSELFNGKRFLQTIIYSGKEKETITQTRSRMYSN